MSNGRVLSAWLIFVVVCAITPWFIIQHWMSALIGGTFGILWWIVMIIWGDTILLKTLGAEPLNVSEYFEIAKLVKTMRCGPGLSHPTMWQINNFSAMVLSIGQTTKNSHIIFTKGYFDKLEDKVQIGLVYREVESIRQGLTAANSALACLLWIILLPGRIITILTRQKIGEPSIASTIFNVLPAFLMGWSLGSIGADKQLINRVDSITLKRLDNPDYIPYGLMKLQESILGAPFNCDLAASGCCIINPNNRDPLQLMFKLHPPTPKRIDRLRIKAKGSRRQFNN